MRLDKYLANAGAGTRSEVKKLLKEGLVTVDGAPVREPDFKLDPAAHTVCCRGVPVTVSDGVCYLFYKPAGCVTARTDRRDRTVMDYFPASGRIRLSPVGRLDKDTEGVLLVTDDGALNHRLTSPACHVEKTYRAVLDAPLPADAAERFLSGIDIGDKKLTLPARLVPCGANEQSGLCLAKGGAACAYLTVTEGRYHQVKRMFAALGCGVVFLERTSFAGLTLEGLSRGEYRRLTEDELLRLRQQTGTGAL